MIRWLSQIIGYGPLRAAMIERIGDHVLGINTRGVVELDGLGIKQSEAGSDKTTICPYQPITFAALFTLLDRLTISPESDTFLDIGCGKGRVLVCAAQYPFRRILGIDLSSELLSFANKNIDRVANNTLCADITAQYHDAIDYVVPDDVTHLFLYNPFIGETLLRVIDNVEVSLHRSPRSLELIYIIPDWTDNPFSGRPGWELAYEVDLKTKDREFGRIYRWANP